jgi:hypothetical protein
MDCTQQLLSANAWTQCAIEVQCDEAHASLSTSGAIIAAIETLTGTCILDHEGAAYQEWQDGNRLTDILDWLQEHYPEAAHGDRLNWGVTSLLYDKNDEEWT